MKIQTYAKCYGHKIHVSQRPPVINQPTILCKQTLQFTVAVVMMTNRFELFTHL